MPIIYSQKKKVEPGTYTAIPYTCALGKAKTGTAYVSIGFNIKDGVGGSIWWNGYFHENSIDRTLDALQCCGWTGDDISDFSEWESANSSGLGETEVSIVVENEVGQDGISRPKLKWINPIDGIRVSTKQELSSSEIAILSNKVKNKLALKKVKQSPAVQAFKDPEPLGPMSDEVPF